MRKKAAKLKDTLGKAEGVKEVVWQFLLCLATEFNGLGRVIVVRSLSNFVHNKVRGRVIIVFNLMRLTCIVPELLGTVRLDSWIKLLVMIVWIWNFHQYFLAHSKDCLANFIAVAWLLNEFKKFSLQLIRLTIDRSLSNFVCNKVRGRVIIVFNLMCLTCLVPELLETVRFDT